MTRIGILSDTHLTSPDADFRRRAQQAFADCQVIIHAGDVTDLAILTCFADKTVYAVHGNMCNWQTRKELPEQRLVTIDGYTFGICHGAGNRLNIEDRMLALFPEADCIIYGHTHTPVCHRLGTTLIINPGSFQSTGRYGIQGTYALIELRPEHMQASLHEVAPL